MSEQTAVQQQPSLEVIKAKFNLELMQNNFQAIQNKVNALVFNEDNIPLIKDTLEQAKKMLKVVDAVHKKEKEPHLTAGKLCDTAKNDLYSIINAIIEPAAAQYTDLCKKKQEREENERREAARKAEIQNGIQRNLIAFSEKIALATTSEQLTSVERMINLEKANQKKYAEFLEEAVSQYNEFLNQPLKDQKAKVRELEEAERLKKEAEEKGDDATFLQLHEKTEALQAQIEEKKVITQENAIAEVTKPVISDYTPVSSPAVKPKRQSWKFEVKDIQATAKKMPAWVNLEPNEEAIKSYLNGKKEEGIPEGTKEFEVAGIHFYLEEKFI